MKKGGAGKMAAMNRKWVAAKIRSIIELLSQIESEHSRKRLSRTKYKVTHFCLESGAWRDGVMRLTGEVRRKTPCYQFLEVEWHP